MIFVDLVGVQTYGLDSELILTFKKVGFPGPAGSRSATISICSEIGLTDSRLATDWTVFPKFFEAVKLTFISMENMDDHIVII